MVEVDDGRVVRSGEVLTIMIGGFGPQSGQETIPSGTTRSTFFFYIALVQTDRADRLGYCISITVIDIL